MSSRTVAVTLKDGRIVDVVAGGAASGPAIVFHHGTPSEASAWGDWSDAVAGHGFSLLAMSRPGYASSTRQPERNVASVASDVREVLDHFAVPWFVTIGLSGGGPHALATAALSGERCRGVATLGSLAPYGSADLDFLAGMGPENVEEFGVAQEGDAALRAWMSVHVEAMRTVSPDAVVDAFGGLIPQVDKDALTGGLATVVASSARRALANGFDGWIDDDLAFVRDWGFSLDAIAVPATIWQGDLDLMVPFAHGDWLAARIPGARARRVDGHGHLSLLTLRDEILNELAATAATP